MQIWREILALINRVPEKQRRRQEVNIKVNQFMRRLYERALRDQTEPGTLLRFLVGTPGLRFDGIRQVWVVNTDGLPGWARE